MDSMAERRLREIEERRAEIISGRKLPDEAGADYSDGELEELDGLGQEAFDISFELDNQETEEEEPNA